ncbi:MAG: hypothetical protein AMJ84_00265 [Acidithiobacillales bacterium SM23_46]|nr:MAG: hypothetical protein AMJ84_00265 [Acidithiobacillales bacterium SM23_46]KPL29010.1 MAG: hypothetical protein AMJ72_00185 [Acidithiobacillales bacterium SM1_46]
MTLKTKVRLYYALVWAVFILWFAFGWNIAEAGGNKNDEVDVDVNVDTPVDVDVTGGDVNVPVDVTTGPVSVQGGDVSTNMQFDSKALGIANSLGDVDIADCLGSTQWSTPVFGRQGLVLNQVCMAEFYLTAGKYKLAAMSLCNVKEILKEFESEEECEEAHDFTPVAPAPEPASEILEQRMQIEEYHEEDIEQVQMQQQQLVARIEALEKRPEPAPRVVRAPAPEPKPAFSEEQKRAAWAALMGGSEDEDDE